VFEFLHLPFFLALLGLSVYQLSVGRPDLAIEDSVVYPLLPAQLSNLFGQKYPQSARLRRSFLPAKREKIA
jgi:hypothetical protein